MCARSTELESKYRLPRWAVLKCKEDCIEVYRKTNAAFYRNLAFDLELVARITDETELKSLAE